MQFFFANKITEQKYREICVIKNTFNRNILLLVKFYLLLTLERLFQISEILDSPLSDLLEIGDNIFQQTNKENATGYQYQQKIKHFYQDNKDIYEKLLQAKDEQMTLLKSMLGNK
jgi:hypothetical protein